MTADSPLPLLLARRELALVRREALLHRENEIFFFQPHAKQEDFYSAAAYHYRYARTGNRFGKSEMGAAEDVAFALGYRPWYPVGHPLRTLGIPSHPTKGLIVTADWDKSTEVFTSQEGPRDGAEKNTAGKDISLGKLFKYIPKASSGQPTRNHSGAIDCIPVRHISGGWSSIHLDTVKSYKQNPLGFESSVWDWIHIDEPVPEGLWKAAARGLIDRDGRAWFTCTPLSEPWIDMMFIPDLEDQTSVQASSAHGDFWMMTGTTDDNPHNTAEATQRVMSLYTEEERETRRSGIPRAYSGLVYKEFHWELHVRRDAPIGWKSWSSPPTDHTLRFAIDYHPRKPHHVLFIATSPLERQFVYAEVFLSCLMDDLFKEIQTTLGGREATVPGVIDPLADTEDRVTGVTPLNRLQQLGLPLFPATKDPSNGILAVKALLCARERTGAPVLQINPACRRFLFEISRGFIWDGETNKPVKANDDAMENFYRLTLPGLPYIQPTTSDDYRPIQAPAIESNVLEFPEPYADWTYEDPAVAASRARIRSRYRA